ncbi:MAG: hypothetical protein WKF35_01040 [Ferruginibacter sp.]
MKKLTREEMKKVMGGYAPDEGGCKTTCYKSNGSGGLDHGTCSAGSVTVNGTSLATCDCSLSGGTSCYNAPM